MSMRLSTVIKRLQAIQEKYGDLPVFKLLHEPAHYTSHIKARLYRVAKYSPAIGVKQVLDLHFQGFDGNYKYDEL